MTQSNTGAEDAKKKTRQTKKNEQKGETPPPPSTHAEGDDLPFTDTETVSSDDATKSLILGERNAEKDIIKLDINKQKIALYKEQYKSLAIADINDKAGYNAVVAAKKVIRTARTTLDNRREALNEFYISEKRKIDTAAKELKDLLVEVEAPIDAMIDQWKKWEEAEKIRKEEEEQAEAKRRVKILLEAGMSFDGSFYVMGDTISMDIMPIKSMNIADFEAFVAKVTFEKQRLDKLAEERRLAEEQRLKEEAEERQKYLDAQKELKEQQEKAEAERREIENERAQMRAEKLQMRCDKLTSIGMQFRSENMHYEFSNDFYTSQIVKSELDTMSNEDFATFVSNNNAKISAARQAQEEKNEADRQERETKQREADALREKQQREREENERKAQEVFMQKSSDLINIGMQRIGGDFIRKNEFNDVATINAATVMATDPDTWPNLLLKVKGDVDALNTLTEEKRAKNAREKELALPAIDRARSYLKSVGEVILPTVENTAVDDVLQAFGNKLEDIIADATAKLNKIEESNK